MCLIRLVPFSEDGAVVLGYALGRVANTKGVV